MSAVDVGYTVMCQSDWEERPRLELDIGAGLTFSCFPEVMRLQGGNMGREI